MDLKSDPRVFFAAERTILAWLRTAIAVMGLGFLVARFGLIVVVLREQIDSGSHIPSTIIGVGLILLGVLMIATSVWQNHRFISLMSPGDLPKKYYTSLSLWLSSLLAISGIILAFYLMFNAFGAV